MDRPRDLTQRTRMARAPLRCSHGPMDSGAFCAPLQLHRALVVASQELLVAAQFSGVAFVVDKEHNW
jgi:hypothetical protein